jgi:hypothetical protein
MIKNMKNLINLLDDIIYGFRYYKITKPNSISIVYNEKDFNKIKKLIDLEFDSIKSFNIPKDDAISVEKDGLIFNFIKECNE